MFPKSLNWSFVVSLLVSQSQCQVQRKEKIRTEGTKIFEGVFTTRSIFYWKGREFSDRLAGKMNYLIIMRCALWILSILSILSHKYLMRSQASSSRHCFSSKICSWAGEKSNEVKPARLQHIPPSKTAETAPLGIEIYKICFPRWSLITPFFSDLLAIYWIVVAPLTRV